MAGKFPFGRSRAGARNEICIVPPKGEPELPSRPAKIQSEVGACLQAIHNAAGRRRENRLQAGSCKRPSFFSSMNAARNRREGCSRESKAENTLPGIPADPQIDRRWTHPFGFPPISHLPSLAPTSRLSPAFLPIRARRPVPNAAGRSPAADGRSQRRGPRFAGSLPPTGQWCGAIRRCDA